MILHVENPEDSTHKKIRIYESSKVAGYKINICPKKAVVFLYTNNNLSEKETRKTILYMIAPKRTKYLGINLTKEVKDLCTENFIRLLRERQKINREISHIHGLEELILLKCPYYPK